MTIAPIQLDVPLQQSSDGVLCVGGTRVTLDTLIATYEEGFTPEEIVQQYPALQLADVFAVLSYVLSHYDEIQQYLHDRSLLKQQVQEENERRFPPTGMRRKLLSRYNQS